MRVPMEHEIALDDFTFLIGVGYQSGLKAKIEFARHCIPAAA